MPFQPQPDTLTYEPYFQLSEKPFSLNGDARFIYPSASYVATREKLLASLRRREGLLVLSGEIGTGKTTLCHDVLQHLGRKTYSAIVPDPFASREDLLKTLLVDFGVLSIDDLAAGHVRQASRTELGYRLAAFLDSLSPETFVVVIIDEAQNLTLPLIEEMRILADTFGSNGRMQIIFVGQPELHAKLKLPEMRQVDQRVCAYHRLAPMGREAVEGYVQHRLRVAGGASDQVLFPAEHIDTLHRRCGGVARLINRVCDRALQIAFERQAQGVDREILDTALIEVGADTLSPTWDAIVFADAPKAAPPAAPPAPSSAAPTTPSPAAPTTPAPAVVPAAAVTETTESVNDDEDFRKQIDDWVAKELTPPPPPANGLTRRVSDAPKPPAAEPRPAPRTTAPRPAPRREATGRSVTVDWPRDLRSETYMQRLWRIWTKRVAVALGVFLLLNAIIIGVMLLADTLSPVDLPASPEAPLLALPLEAQPLPAPDDAPVGAASTAAATAEYFVAIGVFGSRERADQIVDALTRAGLPVMQRPVQLREQQAHQVVLGPFLTRAEAAADLRRLQQLGGFNDAKVIDGTVDRVAQ